MKLKKVYSESAKAKAEALRQQRTVLYDEQVYLQMHLKFGGLDAERLAATHKRIAAISVALASLNSEADALTIAHVEAVHMPDKQKWATKLVDQAIQQGWLRREGNKLIMKTAPGEPDVVYHIRREPGWYCCFDGKKFRDAATARAYTETAYAGQKSPDRNNPSGYEQLHAYDCVKEK